MSSLPDNFMYNMTDIKSIQKIRTTQVSTSELL